MNSPRFHELSDWLTWLESAHPKAIDLGLQRVRKVAAQMGLLKPDAKVVTVAGTNGKGSFVASLNALLRRDGKRVGAYTSPHIRVYNERIVINDIPVDDTALCDAFAAIDAARGDISLTYFEFGTLAAMLLFQQAELDVWLLEVGLGGRLDAVNILDADLAVVMSIALDHQQWLGDTRDAIAREKAGILRHNRPAICAETDIPATLQQHLTEIPSHVYYCDRDFSIEPEGDGWQATVTGSTGQKYLLPSLPPVDLPRASVAAALQAYALIAPTASPQTCRDALRGLSLAGRFQRLAWQGVELIFDVAHNEAAVAHLATSLANTATCDKTFAVLSMMADKAVGEAVAHMIDRVDHWFVAQNSDRHRSATVERLTEALQNLGVERMAITANADVATAVDAALRDADTVRRQGTKVRVVVFGSFVTIGDGLTALKKRDAEILS